MAKGLSSGVYKRRNQEDLFTVTIKMIDGKNAFKSS